MLFTSIVIVLDIFVVVVVVVVIRVAVFDDWVVRRMLGSKIQRIALHSLFELVDLELLKLNQMQRITWCTFSNQFI